ncbi:MAG: hypothetical protein GY939_06230 [Actinomycetia bacterium]|nr:hypothetical protein [Actinomycetes bacterium]
MQDAGGDGAPSVEDADQGDADHKGSQTDFLAERERKQSIHSLVAVAAPTLLRERALRLQLWGRVEVSESLDGYQGPI